MKISDTAFWHASEWYLLSTATGDTAWISSGKLDKQLNNQCDDKQNKKSCRFIYQIDVRCKAEQRSHHIQNNDRIAMSEPLHQQMVQMVLVGFRNLCPLSFLLKIAPMVSTMGTASSRIGSASVIIVELLKPSNEIADIIKPRNKAPQSPMKILAGCEYTAETPWLPLPESKTSSGYPDVPRSRKDMQ